jgi:hypothetical protein
MSRLAEKGWRNNVKYTFNGRDNEARRQNDLLNTQ